MTLTVHETIIAIAVGVVSACFVCAAGINSSFAQRGQRDHLTNADNGPLHPI